MMDSAAKAQEINQPNSKVMPSKDEARAAYAWFHEELTRMNSRIGDRCSIDDRRFYSTKIAECARVLLDGPERNFFSSDEQSTLQHYLNGNGMI